MSRPVTYREGVNRIEAAERWLRGFGAKLISLATEYYSLAGKGKLNLDSAPAGITGSRICAEVSMREGEVAEIKRKNPQKTKRVKQSLIDKMKPLPPLS